MIDSTWSEVFFFSSFFHFLDAYIPLCVFLDQLILLLGNSNLAFPLFFQPCNFHCTQIKTVIHFRAKHFFFFCNFGIIFFHRNLKVLLHEIPNYKFYFDCFLLYKLWWGRAKMTNRPNIFFNNWRIITYVKKLFSMSEYLVHTL